MGDMAEIEETAEHVAGWFHQNYVIIGPTDDIIKRKYTVYSLYSFENPSEQAYAYVPQPTARRDHSELTMNATLRVLLKVNGRSRHFPRLKHHGLIKKLVFGWDGDLEDERDPEWTSRPYIILHHEHVMLSTLLAFSEKGTLPVDLALHAGLGIAYCLAALHRAGFVHRLVSPHSFSYPVPLTLDLLSARMIITDMSLCHPYPTKPRASVPFMGCLRYSSTRVHKQREQGPSDDYISLIYIIAEMISGKLPWRSVLEESQVHALKVEFWQSPEFKRLPKELRKLYKKLVEMASMTWIDASLVIDAFKEAIARRDPNKAYELPQWLVMPSAN
uniref:Protein kinase domain-containing protein n=1 Tax=Panagrellus redivivus TaxID=6233 RepID=A0A7E4VXW8_PANRE